MADTSDTIRFYFAFRSPYSWLGLEKVMAAGRENVDLIPLSRLPEGVPPPNPTSSPARTDYIVRDVIRLSEAAGFQVQVPDPFDTDWNRATNAFQKAKELGAAFPFAQAAYRARWTEGRDLADPDVIAGISENLGLPAGDIVAAMADPEVETRKLASLTHLEEDKPFGVPFLVFRGEPFWGQDRVDLLLERVRAS